jgi:hypothetical protein
VIRRGMGTFNDELSGVGVNIGVVEEDLVEMVEHLIKQYLIPVALELILKQNVCIVF